MYLNNSDKIKIELALSGIKKDLNKVRFSEDVLSSITTSLRQIGAVLQELPDHESCPTCGFQKESLCLDCDNVFSD